MPFTRAVTVRGPRWKSPYCVAGPGKIEWYGIHVAVDDRGGLRTTRSSPMRAAVVRGPVRRHVRRHVRRRWTLNQTVRRFDPGWPSNALPAEAGPARRWTATDDRIRESSS